MRFVIFTRMGLALAALAANAASAQETPAGTGRAVFTQLGCTACHGAEGGGTHAGPRLAGSTLSLSAFVAATRNPQGTMPAYGAQAVSDSELAGVHEYLGPAAAEPAGDAELGADLYDRYGCYSCHADEAQGGMHGPRLGPNPVSFARFAWYVRHPTGQMPPYTAMVMSEQDMADVYAFVKAQPQPPDLRDIPLLAP